jgi:phosphohistidine phosphatase
MKMLYLVRHAKSSWKDLSIDDFNRPLNTRGKNDAPIMGKILFKKKINVELIISSPAKRTRDTANFIAHEVGYTDEIIFNKSLYEASTDDLLAVIKNFSNNFNNVMLIGHNPGLTNLLNYLSNEDLSNIPTCGIVALKSKTLWSEIERHDCEIIFFKYPKKYLS